MLRTKGSKERRDPREEQEGRREEQSLGQRAEPGAEMEAEGILVLKLPPQE